jgi:tRNA A-37 threonylcarbamoyl transferase component Bud32
MSLLTSLTAQPIASGCAGVIHRSAPGWLVKTAQPDNQEDLVAEARNYRLLKAAGLTGSVVPDYDAIHSTEDSLVIEHVLGLELGKLATFKGLIPERWEEACEQVSQAMASFHSMGFVHYDLHAWNVIVSKSKAVLIDFGLAEHRAFNDHISDEEWEFNQQMDRHYLAEHLKAIYPGNNPPGWYLDGLDVISCI